MKFRTEIERIHGSFCLNHDDRIIMLGSCFADNIGERLDRDGFNVVHNPLGPLYNPISLLYTFRRAIDDDWQYTQDDLLEHNGTFHCLDFANRYQSDSPSALLEMVNDDFGAFRKAVKEATSVIFTFGNTKVYQNKNADTIA